jgi:hypothetical protein
LTTWASSEFHDILQNVVAFESLKSADLKYLLSNLGVEMSVDLDDANQLLSLLTDRLNADDKKVVSSLIQNLVVGTALIDEETRYIQLIQVIYATHDRKSCGTYRFGPKWHFRFY